MKPRNNWKCNICPKGRVCKYEKLNTLGCAKLNLSYAWQGLVWSLPLIGKRIRTHESRIRCSSFEPEEKIW